MKIQNDERSGRTGKEPSLPVLGTAFFLPLICAAAYLNMGPTCCGSNCPPPAPPDFTVSKNSDGEGANSLSHSGAVSGNGLYVAFESAATNLGATIPLGLSSVYVHNIGTGETTHVSRWSDGYARYPVMSQDGRFVVYKDRESFGATVGLWAIVVRDLDAGTDEIIRYAADSTLGRFYISFDARYIAINTTEAIDPADTNGVKDLYLKDRVADTLTRVSVPSGGGQYDVSSGGTIAGYAEWVFYNLFEDDPADDTFVVKQLIPPNEEFTFPGLASGIDASGLRVLYRDQEEYFVFDRATGTHELVSLDAFGNAVPGCSSARLSGDGRYVALGCEEPMTSHGAYRQTYVRDLQDGWIKLASVNPDGEPADSGRTSPTSIAFNGSAVIMDTSANNMHSGVGEQVVRVQRGYWDEGVACASDDATCDGVDDDCDGQMDEDYVSQGTSCGVGACASSGSTACSGGQVLDSCVPGTPSGGEACDGVDNNCNGVVDEDAGSVQVTCQIGGCTAVATGPCDSTPDCTAVGVCVSEAGCADAVDNDGDGLTDCWDSDCAASSSCSNAAPTLNPVGAQVVTVGDILRLTLSGNDADGDPVTYSVTPLPLPTHATLNGATGEFKFAPTLSQIGSFALDFSASDGRDSGAQTAVITVQAPIPGGATGVKGRLLDGPAAANGEEVPVVGATIRVLGSSLDPILTGMDGRFEFQGLTPGSVTLEFDGSSAAPPPLPIDPSTSYGAYRATKNVEVGTILELSQDVYLPHIDEDADVVYDPGASGTAMLENTTLGIAVEIQPGSIIDDTGSPPTGPITLTLSSVPPEFTPGALPDYLNPSTVITIQPMGLTFTEPAPITFPNDLGLTPGSEVEIWSLNHSTGQFFVAGQGRVTSDGTKIETIPGTGGIQETSWHFPSPSGPGASGDGDGSGDGGSSGGANGGEDGPPDPCEEDVASRVPLAKGTVSVDVPLPSYTVLNRTVTPRLVYNTMRAHPVPLVPVNAFTIARFAVPDVISYSARLGGVDLGEELFLSTAGLSENVDEPFRVVVPIDAVDVETSVVPLEIRLTSHYGDASVSNDVAQTLPLINGRASPFGVGWGWAGLRRLVSVADDGADRLLVDGNGAYRLFTFDGAQFASPPGDASTLVDDGDGTMTLHTTVGTEVHFDNEGSQERVVFANGNTWSYFYDAEGKLSDIIDPIGGLTSLNYTSGLLSSVEDPANRITNFQHDASGRLVEVSFPDNSTRQFDYDSRDLMTSETDARNLTKYRKFDSAGRLTEVVLEDTSRRFMSAAATVGLLDPSSGVGLSKDNPAPMTVTGGMTTSVDAEARSRAYEFNEFGAATKFVSASSLETTMQYDASGNVLRIDRPSGASRAMTYDPNNNLLTETDEQLGGTTTYTYDPALNRLDSITDANQKTTDIGYNPAGQITSITTPQQRQITMTYTPDGNVDTLSGPLGVQTTFEYDPDGNLSKITRTANGQVRETAFVNDAAGNAETVTDAAGRIVTSIHDSMNRVTSLQGPGTPTTFLGYDADGNNISVTPPSRPSHEFEYDARDWLSSYQPPPAGTASVPMTFARNAEGQETVVSLPDDRSISRSYDSAGRLTTTTIGGNREYVTEYDSTTGLVQRMTAPDGKTLDFLYQGDRIRQAKTGSSEGVLYRYDAMGRIDSLTVLAPTQNCESPSIVATWPADGSFQDPAGGYDATESGGVGYDIGVRGQAFSFDGEDDFLTATVPTLDGATQLSFSVWLRMPPGTNAGDTFVYLPRPGGLRAFRFQKSASNTLGAEFMTFSSMDICGGTACDPSLVHDDGQWHHLVATLEFSLGQLVYRLYFDGQEVDTESTFSFTEFDTTGALQVGGFGVDGYEGQLDELTIYDSTLSAEEVLALYATGCEAGSPTQIQYSYDDDGGVTQAGDVSTTYNSSTGLLETKTLDQVTTTYGHNGFGEITSETTDASGAPSPAYDVTYVRDPLGRVSQKTETLGGQTHTLEYQYDEEGRLTAVIQDATTTLESYTYDDNGNRLTALGVTSTTYDVQDRLIEYGDNDYAYRDSGQLLTKTNAGATTTYDYDELGNLLSVTLPTGTVVDYEIDAMNRRVGRLVDGALTQRWIYKDQLNPIAELDDQGNLVSLFIYGTRSHVPDGMVKDGVRYLFVTDQVGSVRLVVNAETGAVVQSIDYDAWGNVVAETGAGFQPFGFAGGLYDRQTKLVRFGARDYDPEVGRWTAKDPILFDGGQANLYAYVDGDPVNAIDPSGLLSKACTLALSGTAFTCLRCAGLVASAGAASAATLGLGLAAAIPVIAVCGACGIGAAGSAAICEEDLAVCEPPPPGCTVQGDGRSTPCRVVCEDMCFEQ